MLAFVPQPFAVQNEFSDNQSDLEDIAQSAYIQLKQGQTEIELAGKIISPNPVLAQRIKDFQAYGRYQRQHQLHVLMIDTMSKDLFVNGFVQGHLDARLSRNDGEIAYQQQKANFILSEIRDSALHTQAPVLPAPSRTRRRLREFAEMDLGQKKTALREDHADHVTDQARTVANGARHLGAQFYALTL